MIRAVPIYDYRCDACGHAFSAVQSYTDATLEVCPQCGAVPRKLMASPAIVFKGSGWYKTDSRRGSSEAKADARAEGQADGGSDAKTDAKPETKAGGKVEAKGDAKAEPAPKSDTTRSEKPAEAKKGPAS